MLPDQFAIVSAKSVLSRALLAPQHERRARKFFRPLHQMREPAANEPVSIKIPGANYIVHERPRTSAFARRRFDCKAMPQIIDIRRRGTRIKIDLAILTTPSMFQEELAHGFVWQTFYDAVFWSRSRNHLVGAGISRSHPSLDPRVPKYPDRGAHRYHGKFLVEFLDCLAEAIRQWQFDNVGCHNLFPPVLC
jgi:hypothetical protein